MHIQHDEESKTGTIPFYLSNGVMTKCLSRDLASNIGAKTASFKIDSGGVEVM